MVRDRELRIREPVEDRFQSAFQQLQGAPAALSLEAQHSLAAPLNEAMARLRSNPQLDRAGLLEAASQPYVDRLAQAGPAMAVAADALAVAFFAGRVEPSLANPGRLVLRKRAGAQSAFIALLERILEQLPPLAPSYPSTDTDPSYA